MTLGGPPTGLKSESSNLYRAARAVNSRISRSMNGLEEIVKRVLASQEARVLAYAGFESAYRLLSNGGSESAYIAQTKDVTVRFQAASTSINESISDLQKVWAL